MMQVTTKLSHIDFDKLISKIQDQDQTQDAMGELSGCITGLIKNFGKMGLLTNSVSIRLAKPFIKGQITGLTEGFGVHLSELRIRGIKIIKEDTSGGNNMLNISTSIEKIDWDKLLAAISGSTKRPDGQTNDNDNIFQEVVRIIKPFIGKTMATIPPSAFAELFDLLGKKELIKLAGNYGVEVSDLSVEPG